MSARAFWPGFNWRVLAHERGKPNSRGSYTGGEWDVRSGVRWRTPVPGDERRVILDGNWEFDELVIDDWFHIEQMNERQWWLGVGNGDDYWHVNVTIDGRGRASVSVEKQ